MANKTKSLLGSLLILTAAMILLSFAAVPIYNLFCKLTGFDGTVKRAENYYTEKIGNKIIRVTFDSHVNKDLPWQFIPKQRFIDIKPGENTLVFYYSKNLDSQDIKGMAIYNVTPLKASKYFYKVHCFCFEEQTLKAQEEVDMPVSFFIDPAIETDPDTKDLNHITLSYSFFKIEQ
jgi:cytochrome c oxidase assembly protein subunit 11